MLLEQHYVREAQLFLEEFVKENVRTGQQTDYRIWETYFRSHWMRHFYGEKNYRGQLRDAVQGLLTILTQTKDFKKAFLVVIESLRRALTEQLDWSLDDLGSKLDGVDAVEMKFIYAFYDLVSGTVCDSPEALARDVKKLVSDFEEEGGLAQYQ